MNKAFSTIFNNLFFAVMGIFFISNVHAQNYKSDSVMSPGEVANPPVVSNSGGNLPPLIVSSTNTYEYDYQVCPAGLVSKQGTSQYINKLRSITIYFDARGLEVGRSVGAWQDTDEDCVGIDTRHLTCPIGYRGTITQNRTMATDNNGGFNYGAWYQVQNTCVPDVITFVTPNVSFNPERKGHGMRLGQSQYYGPHTLTNMETTMTLSYNVYIIATGPAKEICTGGGGDAGNDYSCEMVPPMTRLSDLTIQFSAPGYVEVYWDRPYSSFGPKYTDANGRVTWTGVYNDEWTDNPTSFTIRLTRTN